MRLLNVHRYGYRKGGAEAVFLDHQELFASNGWECAEFVMRHPENAASNWTRYFPQNFEPATTGFGSAKSALRFLYSHEAKQGMADILADFRPDIVHIHGLYQQLTPAVLQPIAEKKIPAVYTAHDFKLLCPAYSLYTNKLGVCERCAAGNTIYCAIHKCIHNSRAASLVYAIDGARLRFSYGKAIAAFVMPSKFILEKHREYGFPADRLHYIPNFFETVADEPVDAAELGAHRARYGKYVLYFGRLSPEKGIDNLIKACSHAELPLVLLGSGPQESELRALAAQMRTPPTFVSHRTGRELWTFVEAALCVALPAVWYENAPKSILEAQARGQIVVVSNIGGLPELVEDGKTGFLVAPGDITELTRTLLNVSKLDDAAREKIAGEARIRSIRTFTRDKYYSKMVSLYEKLIANSA